MLLIMRQQIKHVFIRDVIGRKNDEEMQALARACRQHGTGFSFFDHVEEVETIARSAGWIENGDI